MVFRKIARELSRPFLRRRKRQAKPVDHSRSDNALQKLDPQIVREQFFTQLVRKTNNFGQITWLGNPIWQNILDLWTIQETIVQVRPDLLIECGTNRGGSSLFFAHLMDLMDHGHIITIDVVKLHDHSHPRITYLLGGSTSAEIVGQVRARAAASLGPVLVILDSDHSHAHVASELEIYAPLVTPGSCCLVQDGAIDTLPMWAGARPGPLPAIDAFVAEHPEFEIDHERCERFLISHHPRGWLRRKAA
jgi:cephalosporin hydroxylase